MTYHSPMKCSIGLDVYTVATALVFDVPEFTRNSKQFERVKGIELTGLIAIGNYFISAVEQKQHNVGALV